MIKTARGCAKVSDCALAPGTLIDKNFLFSERNIRKPPLYVNENFLKMWEWMRMITDRMYRNGNHFAGMDP